MQKTSKKFSIITPVYNRADCIIRCMNSVTRQNGEIEHWIVDDGSTDGTLQVIQEYASLHSHIKICLLYTSIIDTPTINPEKYR